MTEKQHVLIVHGHLQDREVLRQIFLAVTTIA